MGFAINLGANSTAKTMNNTKSKKVKAIVVVAKVSNKKAAPLKKGTKKTASKIKPFTRNLG